MTLYHHLITRRSTSVKLLGTPAPSDAQLQQMLSVATRVPDHGKLAPWKIVVMHEAGQKKLGALAAEIFARTTPDATPAQVEFERTRFMRAPLVLVILSTPVPGKIPVWEQQLSAGAVCLNTLYASQALGFGANWLTEWPAFDGDILLALGGGEGDAIAGFIYVGTATTTPDDRPRPALEDVVRVWG
jgi:nitroreductase